MSFLSYSTSDLINLTPHHGKLVGIDSDGCVFDTMEAKQCRHFHPLIIQHWHLEPLEKELRECAEFTSMFSQWRGLNRFQILLKCFDLFCARRDVQQAGIPLPNTQALHNFVHSGLPLDNAHLKKEISRTDDAELKRILDWSLAVNRDIEQNLAPIPPFSGVARCLEKMSQQADLITVSQTPAEIVDREWTLHGLRPYVQTIAGPELGSKTQHLTLAQGDRWKPTQMLMIGDAPGDQRAAEEVGCHFYPIIPSREETSWARLHNEIFELFIQDKFSPALQDELNQEFNETLPTLAPWEKSA